MRVPDGDYQVTMAITDAHVQLFDIAPEDASIAMNVTVKTVKKRHSARCSHAQRGPLTEERTGSATTNVRHLLHLGGGKPQGACSTSRTSINNIELRTVNLRGKPGARRVTVPPWHGIDTG